MRRRQAFLLFFTILIPSIWPGSQACATTVYGKASTVVEWYDNFDGEAALPVYQYLMFNVREIGESGYGFRGYGRLSEDVRNTTDADSRLYYAYFEKKGFANPDLDVRLGRQFITTSAGASIMDGAYLRQRNLGPLHLSLFGGADVAYYRGYDEQDMIWGAELSGQPLENLNLGLSYLQKWGDSELTHEVLGFNGSYDLLSLLKIYTDLQYSWLTDELTYTLAGMNYHRSAGWNLRTEYLSSVPVFSSTSIYSVFATDKYEEVMGEFSFRAALGLRAFARVTHEIYEETSDAEVYEAGIEKIRTKRLSGYLAGILRQDNDGQDLQGVKFRLGYLVNRFIDTGLGVHYNVMERRLDDQDDETTSKRFWLDATMYLTSKIDLQAKVESIESELWDRDYRGRIRFNVRF